MREFLIILFMSIPWIIIISGYVLLSKIEKKIYDYNDITQYNVMSYLFMSMLIFATLTSTLAIPYLVGITDSFVIIPSIFTGVVALVNGLYFVIKYHKFNRWKEK